MNTANNNAENNNPLENLTFQNETDKLFLREWLNINDSITLHIIPREDWNDNHGNFLVENNKGGDGINKPKGYDLVLPEDIKNGELLRLIEDFSLLNYYINNENPDFPAVNTWARVEALSSMHNQTVYYKFAELIKVFLWKLKDSKKFTFDEINQWVIDNSDYISIETWEIIRNISMTQDKVDEITKYDPSIKKAVADLDEVKGGNGKRVSETETQAILAREYKLNNGLSIFERGSKTLYDFMGVFTQNDFDEVIQKALDEGKMVYIESVESGREKKVTELSQVQNLENGKSIGIYNSKTGKLEISMDTPRQQLETVEQTLRNLIQVEGLKKQLNEARKGGDIEDISVLEIEITNKIISNIYDYPWQKNETNNSTFPKWILENKQLICVGEAILAHIFLKELGIKHYGLDLSSHSALSIITANAREYYVDPTNYIDIVDITEKLEVNQNKYGAYEHITNLPDLFSLIQRGDPERILMSQMLNNKGNAYSEQGKYDLAIECYKKAIELNPNYAAVYSNLGNIYYNQGKYDLAIESHKKAIELNPNLSDAYNNLGFVFLKEALLFSKEKYICYSISNILEGNFNSAISNLNKYLSFNGWFLEKDINPRIKAIKGFLEEGKKDEALSLAKELFKEVVLEEKE